MILALIGALCLATLFTLPFVYIFLLSIVWTTTHPFIEYLLIVAMLILYVYIWLMVLYRYRRHAWLSFRKQLFMVVPFLSCIVFLLATFGYDMWENRYEIKGTEVNLSEYKPFHSYKIATLNKESQFQIKDELVRLDGATALYPVYASFVQALYPKDEYDPYVSEIVSCTTTPTAYGRLLEKKTDLIFVAAPSSKQEEMFKKQKEELVKVPIGKEAFVFFVNKDNPVTNLSSKQIRDIYSGKITNWKEVGGKDEKIRAFQRPEGSGSQSALIRFMNGQSIMKPMTKDVPAGMGAIISVTAEYENRDNAIGYSFRFYTQAMKKSNKIKLLQIDGVAPTVEHIRDDIYPITSPFYAVYVKGNENKNLMRLINWIQSDEGQQLIEKTGYVSIIQK